MYLPSFCRRLKYQRRVSGKGTRPGEKSPPSALPCTYVHMLSTYIRTHMHTLRAPTHGGHYLPPLTQCCLTSPSAQAPDSSTDAPPGAKYSLLSFPRAAQWADPQQKCTIVELHNRKGCLFEEKASLPAGMDMVIPTPSSSGSKTNTSGSPFDVP